MEQLNIFGENKKLNSKSIILSASRMTDMPKFYPLQLIDEVERRIEKGVDIHTLVLWSKHPDSLLVEPLFSYLKKLKDRNIQLFFQCTITGMGSKVIGKNKDKSNFILEPNVPKYSDSIKALSQVIELLDNPLKIRLRIDPIVRIKNIYTENIFTNIIYVDKIIGCTSKLGIKNYTFSFLESNIHNKVDRRFNDYEWKILSPNMEEKIRVNNWLDKKAKKYNVNISACCVSGLEESRCIDGYLLTNLHKLDKSVSLKEPRKRALCACTDSIDIGGWPPKKCYSGCKYCYANAKI